MVGLAIALAFLRLPPSPSRPHWPRPETQRTFTLMAMRSRCTLLVLAPLAVGLVLVTTQARALPLTSLPASPRVGHPIHHPSPDRERTPSPIPLQAPRRWFPLHPASSSNIQDPIHHRQTGWPTPPSGAPVSPSVAAPRELSHAD